MKYCLITFRSVTPGQRAEGYLRKLGVECTLQRTPRWMEEQGCGYSLRVRFSDVTMAVQMLRKQEIPFRKVYLQTGGKAEEMAV